MENKGFFFKKKPSQVIWTNVLEGYYDRQVDANDLMV